MRCGGLARRCDRFVPRGGNFFDIYVLKAALWLVSPFLCHFKWYVLGFFYGENCGELTGYDFRFVRGDMCGLAVGETVRFCFVFTVCALAELFARMAARAERVPKTGIPYEKLFFAWGGLFAWSWSDSQGRSLRGTAPGGTFDKEVLYKVGRKYGTTNRVSGPPWGEALARSSLVPRDLTAEQCLMQLASLVILLLRIRLAAFFIGRC